MVLVKKGNALRIPKIYRNLSLLFPSLRYFNFSKDVFKPNFKKMTKTVNLHVRVQKISSTCEAYIL